MIDDWHFVSVDLARLSKYHQSRSYVVICLLCRRSDTDLVCTLQTHPPNASVLRWG